MNDVPALAIGVEDLQKLKRHCMLTVVSRFLPRIHSPRPLGLTMLSLPFAALVAVSLLVTFYRVLCGRRSAAIRRLQIGRAHV